MKLTPIDKEADAIRWIAFHPDLPDETVAECIAPNTPLEIRREENAPAAIVIFHSDDPNISKFQNRFDEAELELEALKP